MKTVHFEIKSFLKFELDLVKYEKISSEIKWVKKGIELTEKYFPKILEYLSKQNVIANLSKHRIVIESDSSRSRKFVKKIFSVWIRKEKIKRIFLVTVEGILIPFTGILALLPGPNFFFYIPALFFYYHLKSLKGLKKIDLEKMEIEVVFIGKALKSGG